MDIDLILKSSKILLNGSSGFSAARLFEHFDLRDFQHFVMFKNGKGFGFFLDLLRSPGVAKDPPKIEIIGFGARRHVPNPKIIEIRVFWFSHK